MQKIYKHGLENKQMFTSKDYKWLCKLTEWEDNEGLILSKAALEDIR